MGIASIVLFTLATGLYEVLLRTGGDTNVGAGFAAIAVGASIVSALAGIACLVLRPENRMSGAALNLALAFGGVAILVVVGVLILCGLDKMEAHGY